MEPINSFAAVAWSCLWILQFVSFSSLGINYFTSESYFLNSMPPGSLSTVIRK